LLKNVYIFYSLIIVHMYNKIKYNKSNVQKNKKVDKQIEQTLVDEIDKKILKKLLTDSRFSYRQIARELKLSVGTVLKRIKRLEKGGIIKLYDNFKS